MDPADPVGFRGALSPLAAASAASPRGGLLLDRLAAAADGHGCGLCVRRGHAGPCPCGPVRGRSSLVVACHSRDRYIDATTYSYSSPCSGTPFSKFWSLAYAHFKPELRQALEMTSEVLDGAHILFLTPGCLRWPMSNAEILAVGRFLHQAGGTIVVSSDNTYDELESPANSPAHGDLGLLEALGLQLVPREKTLGENKEPQADTVREDDLLSNPLLWSGPFGRVEKFSNKGPFSFQLNKSTEQTGGVFFNRVGGPEAKKCYSSVYFPPALRLHDGGVRKGQALCLSKLDCFSDCYQGGSKSALWGNLLASSIYLAEKASGRSAPVRIKSLLDLAKTEARALVFSRRLGRGPEDEMPAELWRDLAGWPELAGQISAEGNHSHGRRHLKGTKWSCTWAAPFNHINEGMGNGGRFTRGSLLDFSADNLRLRHQTKGGDHTIGYSLPESDPDLLSAFPTRWFPADLLYDGSGGDFFNEWNIHRVMSDTEHEGPVRALLRLVGPEKMNMIVCRLACDQLMPEDPRWMFHDPNYQIGGNGHPRWDLYQFTRRRD